MISIYFVDKFIQISDHIIQQINRFIQSDETSIPHYKIYQLVDYDLFNMNNNKYEQAFFISISELIVTYRAHKCMPKDDLQMLNNLSKSLYADFYFSLNLPHQKEIDKNSLLKVKEKLLMFKERISLNNELKTIIDQQFTLYLSLTVLFDSFLKFKPLNKEENIILDYLKSFEANECQKELLALDNDINRYLNIHENFNQTELNEYTDLIVKLFELLNQKENHNVREEVSNLSNIFSFMNHKRMNILMSYFTVN